LHGAVITCAWQIKWPKLRKYARTRAGTKGGWITRAEKFLSPTNHLSPAEF